MKKNCAGGGGCVREGGGVGSNHDAVLRAPKVTGAKALNNTVVRIKPRYLMIDPQAKSSNTGQGALGNPL